MTNQEVKCIIKEFLTTPHPKLNYFQVNRKGDKMKHYVTYRKNDKVIKTVKDITELQNFIISTKDMPKHTQRKTMLTKNTSRYTKSQELYKMTWYLRSLNNRYPLVLDIDHLFAPDVPKANHFYKFKIPKKSGGFREITAPDPEIKKEFKRVKDYLEDNIKMLSHPSAYAYTRKTSTYDAIKKHQQNQSEWFLKVDLKDFFDNCNQELIIKQLSQIYPLNTHPRLIKELAEFATLDDKLPQGTPLSPLLTNLIMIPFDYHFDNYCREKGFIYTRYADDLIISHKESFEFQKITKKITHLMKKLDYPFEINEKKTRYGSRKGQNWNLGLMLNKDNQITLGHEYKNQCKVILYKLALGELPKDDPSIMGLFSYLKQIEPNYYGGLNNYAIRKHGEPIKSLLKSI